MRVRELAPGARQPETGEHITLGELLVIHEWQARGRVLAEWESVLLDQLREHGPWIQTHSGRAYPLLAPRPDDVSIEDIAYALSNLARYTGHADRDPQIGHAYSVAQHCVLASRLVPADRALEALMHDAAEAYVGDASRPMKACIPELGWLERISYLAIARRFGLHVDREMHPDVKHADLVLLATEWRDLMAPQPRLLPLPEAHPDRIEILSPWQAERAFLHRFHELHASTVRTAGSEVKS